MNWSIVTKEHVDAAIKKFITEKPEHPEPRSYYLIYEGEKLPSKYIRGLAYSIASGEELNLEGFNGGVETVDFFKKYGYVVEKIDDSDKYSVNDAVWIATAILAAEKYSTAPNATREDMYFRQADIVKKAQSLITSKVDSARVSWWVNADNEKHTQNYLRADSLVNPSGRRLALMDEFPEKTYPADLNTEDEFEVNGNTMTMEELFFFVREQYPEVIRKMQTVDIDYVGVLDYLANNQEIPYSNPEATGISEEEKNNLLAIKQRGQDAVAEMKKMAGRCETIFGLDKCLPGSWLDGSNTKTRKYLWTQMKYKEYADNPVSISLFVEKNNGVTRYRISLEIKNDGTDKQTMAKYHSHLDMPLGYGMVYVAGSNEWGNPAVINDSQEEIKDKIAHNALRKVQISIYVEPDPNKTNEQYDAEVMEGVKKIIPYYEHVIGKDASKKGPERAWLLTWNPASWIWEEYKEWCVDTKQGNSHVESWTCASKQPAVGDEIFLIKTGAKPRGIIAHGTVSKESYESAHYDPEKAAQGVTANHIDAEFDWIQDYETEPMLSQDDLKVKLPDQQWSPMGSGIEIKASVLPELRKMWNDLIGKGTGEIVYWPSLEEYDPGIDKELWLELLNDTEVTILENLRMFKMMLQLGGESTCANLAEKFGGTAASYNGLGRAFGERIHKKTGCPLCIDEERERYYTIPFVGRNIIEKGKSRYSWKLREELKEALEEMDLTSIDISVEDQKIEYDKNMILYGPPGTGKTYSTAIYAVAICDELDIESVKAMDYDEVMIRYRELTAAGRVAFTTFHQSYGYEEFIEGIKPIVDEESDDVGYSIEPGVFKKFCETAKEKKVSSEKLEIIKKDPVVWKISLEGSGDNPTKRDCYENDRIRIGWDKRDRVITDSSECNSAKERTILTDFEYSMAIGDIVVVLRDQYSIDGIGVVTGDYEWLEDGGAYPRSRKVEWLAKNINENIRELNHGKSLTSSTVYRLNVDAGEIIKLAKMNNSELQITVEENKKNYVFVIDEINRGNISKIFGELITLIEDTKREGMDEQASAVLPYSGDKFSVPSNVYILGTMNTADRSIALMDTALRRRFQFVEMMPDADVLRDMGADKVEDLDVAAMLEKINERITFLYDREHTIGHAFFTRLAKHPDIETLQSIFEKSVIPLLQEYFYEDYQKIQLVLGDNGKTDASTKFILDEEVKVKNIFKGNADDVVDLPEKKYSINTDAFSNIESYKQIM